MNKKPAELPHNQSGQITADKVKEVLDVIALEAVIVKLMVLPSTTEVADGAIMNVGLVVVWVCNDEAEWAVKSWDCRMQNVRMTKMMRCIG